MKKYIVIVLLFAFVGLLLNLTACRKKTVNVTPPASQSPSDIDQRLVYYNSVMTQKAILSDAFNKLDILIQNPKPNDQQWNFQVDVELTRLQSVLQKKYGDICPAVYSDANIEYLKALEDYKYFADNYPNAIKNMNNELLKTCSAKLSQGYQSITTTAKILDSKKK